MCTKILRYFARVCIKKTRIINLQFFTIIICQTSGILWCLVKRVCVLICAYKLQKLSAKAISRKNKNKNLDLYHSKLLQLIFVSII